MKQKNKNNKQIIINKILICTLIFLTIAITCKTNDKYKEKIYEQLYEKNIDFSYFKKIYNNYLGGISQIKKQTKTEYVFNEKIEYTSKEDYQNGGLLTVSMKYLVPNLEKGIITYVGEKEEFNNTIIVTTDENIKILYGNICNINVKLYDNIEKSYPLGEVCNNQLYIKVYNDNKNLDYNKYI